MSVYSTLFVGKIGCKSNALKHLKGEPERPCEVLAMGRSTETSALYMVNPFSMCEVLYGMKFGFLAL